MTLTFTAVYENGVLRPKEPLALAEGAEVRVSMLGNANSQRDDTTALIDDNPVARTAGILKWHGTPEELQAFLEDRDHEAWA